MELPQPRPLGAEGRKQTHDFLSLYSPVQQDPRPPPPPQGNYLKTHDFLQPLHLAGENSSKEETTAEKTSEKPPPPAPPPPGEHFLPGGIGTYSISHISFFNQKVPKLEGGVFTVAQASSTDRNDENSNCSSYSANGFTLWERSAMKGKTGKENIAGDRRVSAETGVIVGGGEWLASERPSQSSSNNSSSHHRASTTYSSFSSSPPLSAQKNQSFMDMIKSAKVVHEEDDEEETQFVIKEEPLSHPRTCDLTVKVDGKRDDQKPNTPRSKHSATEQRRRSKINDRFQMLRELIPRSNQKRDKASFLLEVIEYIQYLQEKVQKYEGPYQGWNQEPAKLMPWKNCPKPAKCPSDQACGANSSSAPALMSAPNLSETEVNVSTPIPMSGQNPLKSDMSSMTDFKTMDQHPGLADKAMPLSVALQSNIFSPGENGSTAAPMLTRVGLDVANASSQPRAQFWPIKSFTTDCAIAGNKLKDHELPIESGTINISRVYSQGLLNTLTQALQSSGVDLSRATISVQIDLGKQANGIVATSTSNIKEKGIPSSNRPMTHYRVGDAGVGTDQALKRLKTRTS